MRRLVLRREVLAELTTAELTSVVAAGAPTLPVRECVVVNDPSDKIAVCDSLLRPCITYTCTR